MSPQMNSKWSPLTETFTTIFARIWFLPTMNSFVHNQVIFLGEAFRAVCANIWFEAGMHSQMYSQLIFLSKPFSTSIA